MSIRNPNIPINLLKLYFDLIKILIETISTVLKAESGLYRLVDHKYALEVIWWIVDPNIMREPAHAKVLIKAIDILTVSMLYKGKAKKDRMAGQSGAGDNNFNNNEIIEGRMRVLNAAHDCCAVQQIITRRELSRFENLIDCFQFNDMELSKAVFYFIQGCLKSIQPQALPEHVQQGDEEYENYYTKIQERIVLRSELRSRII